MRFGNILNELLMEYAGSGNSFDNNGDLILSVADDSTDYYVMTVSSQKFKRILGTFTVFTNKKELEGGGVETDATIEHKFEKVPNQEVMLMALGLYPNAILNYMFHIKYAGDDVPFPKRIFLHPKSPVEKRIFAGSGFNNHLYGEFYAKLGRNNENPMSSYYNRGIDGGGIMYFRY